MPVMDQYPTGMMDPIITKIANESAINIDSGVRSIDMLAKVAEACIREEEMNIATQYDNEKIASNKSTSSVSHSNDVKTLKTLNKKAVKQLIHNDASLSSNLPQAIANSKYYTLKQIRKLSEKRLLSIFTERLQKTKNKNKILSYKCQINPQTCQLKFECFNPVDETVVRRQVAEHLMQHVSEFESKMPEAKIISSKRIRPRKPKPITVVKEQPPSPELVQSQPIDLTAPKNPPISTVSPKKQPTTTLPGEKLIQVTVQPYKGVEIEPTTLKLKPEFVSTSTSIIASKSSLIVTPQDLKQNTINSGSQASSNTRILNLPAISQPTSAILNAAVGDVAPTNLSPPANPLDVKSSSVQRQQQQQLQTDKKFDQQSEQAQLDQKLALDYIDDIRKKSSSAAKAVMINGDRALIYQCKLCPDKQFTSTNGLIFHYKKHAGLKPYVCDVCSNTFTRQHSLNYHMLIHLNKSRFVCEECGRHFRHPSHFKEHMRRHTGETPFQCGDCLIKFKTRNTYKRHLHTKHSKILTSKGIIERASAPYQSPPKPLTNTTTVIANPAGATEPTLAHTNNGTLMSGTIVTSNQVKPRRNYKIDRLRDNLERIGRYEEEQQQQPQQQLQLQLQPQQQQQQQQQPQQQQLAAHTLPQSTNVGQVIDLSNSQTTNNPEPVLNAVPPQSYPVAIYNLPSMPGMNTVHILDHNTAARIGKPFVDLTEPLYNQAQPILAATMTTTHPAVAVVSITAPSAIMDDAMQPPVSTGESQHNPSAHHHPPQHQTHHLTELKNSNVLLTAAAATQHQLSSTANIPIGSTLVNNPIEHSSRLQPQASSQTIQQIVLEHHSHPSSNTTPHLHPQLPQSSLSQPQQTQPPPPPPTTNNNENFMRLLEAIALTEEP